MTKSQTADVDFPAVNDWQPGTELLERELATVDAIAARTVSRIREELPDFVLVPLEEHTETVREQLRRRLTAFLERRAWDPADLEQAVQLARRRARQGVSVDSLISAFHVGDRELWRALSRDPGEAAALLPELTSLMLESMQAVSTTLAAAHSRETRERDRLHMSTSQRFVELLSVGELVPELTRLAIQLGIDDRTRLVALAMPDPDNRLADTDVNVGSTSAIHAWLGASRVVLLRGLEAGDRAISEAASQRGFTGVGEVRDGVIGAVASLQQALLAVSVATPANPVREFAHNWHLCGLESVVPLLGADVRKVVDTASANAALRTTVQAFAACDLSKQRCAAACHIHPNTVTYRLDRWAELTGWDPRTFHGLTRSILACHLADTERAGSHNP